ncbi:hypothetical protein FRC03_010557 [Tulasnella sp. 419]|nr:hypothetical protein FRC03_010557 [Tulasnella sp. 419]
MKMATLTSHPSPDVPESKNCSDPGLVGINRLSLQDTTSGFPKSPSYGQLKPLGIAALVPTITIIFWSIGMGSVLLVWLLAKRISPVPGSPSHIFDGYLVVDEGNKTGSVEELDGEEGLESTMTAVLIITAISHFSTMAVIPLMALGAFYVAAKWLDDQALIKDGPTPLQLGLVMNMCSTGSWNSVTVTSSYLLKHWRTRGQTTHTKVSPLLYSALIICSTVVILHYGVVFTDLWLTADIGSAYYSMIEEVRVDNSFIASGLGTQWNPDVETWLYIQNGTQGTLSESAISFLKEGLGIFTDRSAKNHIQVINTSTSALIQGTSSMSIIVRPPSGIPPQWSWTAPTIGMTTQCQPAPCRPTVGKDSRESVKSCPEPSGISYPSIPLPSWDYLATFMVRPNPPYFIIERYGPTGVWISQDIPRNMSLEPQANPSYMLLELFFNSDHWNERRDRANLGEALSTWNGVNRIFTLYLGACEMTLYNVEVSLREMVLPERVVMVKM